MFAEFLQVHGGRVLVNPAAVSVVLEPSGSDGVTRIVLRSDDGQALSVVEPYRVVSRRLQDAAQAVTAGVD